MSVVDDGVLLKHTEWIFNGVLAGTDEEFEYTSDCVCGNAWLYDMLVEVHKDVKAGMLDAAIAAINMPDYGDDSAVVLLNLGIACITLIKGRDTHSTRVRLLRDVVVDSYKRAA